VAGALSRQGWLREDDVRVRLVFASLLFGVLSAGIASGQAGPEVCNKKFFDCTSIRGCERKPRDEQPACYSSCSNWYDTCVDDLIEEARRKEALKHVKKGLAPQSAVKKAPDTQPSTSPKR